MNKSIRPRSFVLVTVSTALTAGLLAVSISGAAAGTGAQTAPDSPGFS